ncbi:MAG: ABC transporter substrate-binding protein [Candidatus Edwardsbacteria bacterium]
MNLKPLLYFPIFYLLSFGCTKKVEKSGQIEVTFWHVMGGPLGKTLDEMVAEFNKTHPKILLKTVSMGSYTALSQKIMAAVAAGNPPEMAQAYESWTSQLIETASITPIQDFIDGPNGLSKEDLADFWPAMLRDNTFDGKIWSFPFNKSVPVYYYNKRLFRQEGIEQFPKDWGEFLNAAKRLTKDTNGDGLPEQWGTAFPIGATWMFQCLLLQNGGKPLSDDGKKTEFNSLEGVEALTYLVDQLHKEKVAYLVTGFEHQNDLLAGKVGMIQSSIASLAYIREALQRSKPEERIEMGLAPLPAQKRKGVVLSGTNVILFSKPPKERQEAAWEFIKWMSLTENTAKWAIGSSYLPLRQSALKTEIFKKYLKENPRLSEVIEQVNYAEPEPQSVIWFNGRTILEEEGLQSALKGIISPQEALNLAAEKINKIQQK